MVYYRKLRDRVIVIRAVTTCSLSAFGLMLASCEGPPGSVHILSKFEEPYKITASDKARLAGDDGFKLFWNSLLGSCRSTMRGQRALGINDATDKEITSTCECNAAEATNGMTVDDLKNQKVGPETGICPRYYRDIKQSELKTPNA